MRLMVVVAHPDDESFGCGSLLAAASAAGHTTAVLCATRGEAGESRIATDDLAALREGELRTAAGILGVGSIHVLDHTDSGMSGEPAPGTLVTADRSRLEREIAAVISDVRPDVVVTLDASDGHRDHAAIRDATLAAIDMPAGHRPEATYLYCLERSSMRRWAEHISGGPFGDAYLSLSELGTPDEEITTRIDVTSHLDTRWRAIEAHASQASPFDDLPIELQADFLTTDRLRLVRGSDVLPSML